MRACDTTPAIVTWLLGAALVAAVQGAPAVVLAQDVPPTAGTTPIVDILKTAPAAPSRTGPTRIEGVVTMWQREQFVGVVQDNSAAMWVACWQPDVKDRVRGVMRQGMRVVLEGIVTPGGYSPLFEVRAIEMLREDELPNPRPADLERLFVGADNALRVECDGIVQSERRHGDQFVDLVLAVGARRLQAQILEGGDLPPPDQLVDARVRLTAVVGAVRNTRGEFMAPRLVAQRADDLVVVEPPPSAMDQMPVVSLANIGRYRYEPLGTHRIHTTGIVTYATPEAVFLQDGLRGVKVVPASPPDVVPGDRVQVQGFIETASRIAGIREATITRLERGLPPDPITISPSDIVRINSEAIAKHLIADPSDYHGCLIEFPATVSETRRADTDGAGELVLTGGGVTAVALLSGKAFDPLANLRPGTQVRVTGVAQLHVPPAEPGPSDMVMPVLRQVTVLLRTPDDVKVLVIPSWWTPRRLMTVLATVTAVLVGALVWAGLLRRQVHSQSRMLAREMRLRRDAAIEYEASLRERNRLAANLHDTLLQTLGGIDYQLGACRATSGAGGPAATEHLDVAGKMVEHATKELRGSVWALRTVPLVGQSFHDSVQTLLNQLSQGRSEKLTLESSGQPFQVPNFVAGNLLLVIQEAIHNALQHARCTTVSTTIGFDADRGAIRVTVDDDGAGFHLGEQRGPQQGHFGVQGMRERVERLGGLFEIASAPGDGTTVLAVIRTRDYDADLEDVSPQDANAGSHS